MILFKIWLFKLSDIDQGIHKDDIQKKQKFCAFWKKLLGEKENSLKLLCLGLQCFFWKGLFDFKIQFAVEKFFFDAITKSLGNIFVSQLKVLIIQFPYMGVVW